MHETSTLAVAPRLGSTKTW